MMAKSPRALAVTSGKGGVGKSCIALNLGVTLARGGQRILLVDADLGKGNLAILTGIAPRYTIESVLAGACTSADAIVEDMEVLGPGVALLPAASGARGETWPPALGALGVAEDIGQGFDLVIVDTAAGVDRHAVEFAAGADDLLVVVTPEPTSIADAYATLKVILGRRSDMGLGLLVNMADPADDPERIQGAFQQMATRFLGAQIDNRGYIPFDRSVREATRQQTPFALANRLTPAGAAIEELAADLSDLEGCPPIPGPGFLERVLQPHLIESIP